MFLNNSAIKCDYSLFLFKRSSGFVLCWERIKNKLDVYLFRLINSLESYCTYWFGSGLMILTIYIRDAWFRLTTTNNTFNFRLICQLFSKLIDKTFLWKNAHHNKPGNQSKYPEMHVSFAQKIGSDRSPIQTDFQPARTSSDQSEKRVTVPDTFLCCDWL